MSRIAVLGGSVCGLYTGLVLARRGHDVVVVERDAAPPEQPDDAALRWRRPGTPQFRHAHTLMTRGRDLLRMNVPDAYEDLLAIGARETRLNDHLPDALVAAGPRPGDDDIVMLSARRPLLDWALSRAARRAGLEVVRTAAVGIVADAARVPRVRGLQLADGDTVLADVVVDATGRRSRVAEWLADAGAEGCAVSATACGNRYFTRYFELASGAEPPPLLRGFVGGGDVDGFMVLVVRGDGRTFSVLVQTEEDDREMHLARHAPAFDVIARSAPWAKEWIDCARPLNEPQVLGSQQNMLRRGVVDGHPVATGVLFAGDAIATTNPTYGRGLSLALWSGNLVATAVDSTSDPGDRVLALDAAVVRDIEPWVVNAQEMDVRSRAQWRFRLYGEPAPPEPEGLTYEDIAWAALEDRDIWQAMAWTTAVIKTPDELLHDPFVQERVTELKRGGWSWAPTTVVARKEVVEAAAAAVGGDGSGRQP